MAPIVWQPIATLSCFHTRHIPSRDTDAGEIRRRRNGLAGTLAEKPTAWLDRPGPRSGDGRRPRPAAGRESEPTECALTHYPTEGGNAVRFRHPAKRGASHPATPKTDRASWWRINRQRPPAEPGAFHLARGSVPPPRCIPPEKTAPDVRGKGGSRERQPQHEAVTFPT